MTEKRKQLEEESGEEGGGRRTRTLPKKCGSAYNFYLRQRLLSLKGAPGRSMERMKVIAAEWANMSEAERAEYEQKYQAYLADIETL